MNSRGSIIIAIIFLVLLSFIGLTLLTFSYMHNKIEGVRIKKVVQTEKIFQDLVYYLHHFREEALAENLTEIEAPEVDYFNTIVFPEREINGTIISNSFASSETQKQYFKKTRILNTIDAAAASNRYAYKAEADIDMLGGRIPLTMFPVFINKKIDYPVASYLKEKKIISMDGKEIVVGEIETELDMTGFLKESIEIDKGSTMSWEVVRERFGFERSSEPIPEGIHILSGEDTVKLIFIQGDVEKIVFSIRDNRQHIGIRKDGIDYELSYEPGEYDFHCWDTRIADYSLFKEKIVVNGSAFSIEQGGAAAFLSGSNIVLFVSRLAIIRTDLKTQQLDLKEIPLSNFTLIGSSTGLPDSDSSNAAEVIIDTAGETDIQAAVICDGKVTNRSSKLNFSGSLYARELENEGVIEVTHLEAKYDSGSYFATKDFKYISDFFINFIEEVYDEQ
ncbi:MAG: hypothetical protein KAT34_12630 [Candidatus Aminicenantes bacterium]|nr:hypothetical protein [Candidatus Aminicenantes bacterium]